MQNSRTSKMQANTWIALRKIRESLLQTIVPRLLSMENNNLSPRILMIRLQFLHKTISQKINQINGLNSKTNSSESSLPTFFLTILLMQRTQVQTLQIQVKHNSNCILRSIRVCHILPRNAEVLFSRSLIRSCRLLMTLIQLRSSMNQLNRSTNI